MGGSPVKAGKLNRQVILQSPDNDRESDGSVDEDWADEATVYAEIKDIGGVEKFEAGKVMGEETHLIRIRFRTDVKRIWRIKLEDTATSPATNRFFGIIRILNPGDGRRELHILAKENPDGDAV